MRDICAQYFVDNPVVTGGQGIEVESYGKVCHGRWLEGNWAFSGVERITGKFPSESLASMWNLTLIRNRPYGTFMYVVFHHYIAHKL